MSTHYVTEKNIRFDEIFDGRLEKFGIREDSTQKDSCDSKRCLTDGRNFLWVCSDQEGKLNYLIRYFSCGAPQKILCAICETFETDAFNEYEPQYWGFDTEEEWAAALEELDKEIADEFYVDLINYIKDKPHNLSKGTIGMRKAEIAKTLVSKNANLLLEENKAKLLSEVREIYSREHGVSFAVDDDLKMRAKLHVTHEDDIAEC